MSIEPIDYNSNNEVFNFNTAPMKYQHLKENATHFLQMIGKKKEEILKEFSGSLLPAAKVVVDEIYHDAEHLKDSLDRALDGGQEVQWASYAKQYEKIYSKLQDHPKLVEKIIGVAADRVKASIQEDVKFVQDYQNHTLTHLLETEEDIEYRLQHAIQEHLKELAELGKEIPEHTSIAQTAEWIEDIHKKRTKYSENILMKIDAVAKKEMHQEELHFVGSHSELEHEISFIEKEVVHLEEELKAKHLMTQEELNSLEAHVKALREHIEEINSARLPRSLKEKLDLLHSRIV